MSPADREQGQVPPQRLAGQGDLERIPLRMHGTELGVRRLAVQARVDVRSTRQHEPSDVIEQLRRVAGLAGREDEGQAATRLHRAYVIVAQAEDLGLLARVLDRDADGRPPHMRSGTGIPRRPVSTAMWRTN